MKSYGARIHLESITEQMALDSALDVYEEGIFDLKDPVFDELKREVGCTAGAVEDAFEKGDPTTDLSVPQQEIVLQPTHSILAFGVLAVAKRHSNNPILAATCSTMMIEYDRNQTPASSE